MQTIFRQHGLSNAAYFAVASKLNAEGEAYIAAWKVNSDLPESELFRLADDFNREMHPSGKLPNETEHLPKLEEKGEIIMHRLIKEKLVGTHIMPVQLLDANGNQISHIRI